MEDIQLYSLIYLSMLSFWFRYRWIMHHQFMAVREYLVNDAIEEYTHYRETVKRQQEQLKGLMRKENEAINHLLTLEAKYGVDICVQIK